MSNKSYLQDQIWLMTLNGTDFFDDEELSLIQQISNIKDASEEGTTQRKALQEELDRRIASHKGVPRKVNPNAVLTRPALDEGKTAISWYDLKLTRRIAEFCSEESRIFGLNPKDITYDKIVVKWKYLNILEQLVMDGFYMDVLQDDGTVEEVYYIIHTASAGQLRTQKVQALRATLYKKCRNTLECGLSEEAINNHGGINYNKYMSYKALCSSATERWLDDTGQPFNIDRCIVVPDFEAPVTGIMKYIRGDYTSEVGERTVMINHFDGAGMMLPKVMSRNVMCRGPWLKGLLTPFDYIKFCDVNNCPPVIKDRWGKEHDLVAEDIQVIFTDSQLKLAKYYESWDDYKQKFKENNCHLCLTNYEEDYIKNSQMNYQFLCGLTEMTDEEIDQFCAKTQKHIESVCTTQEGMLDALGCNRDILQPYQEALKLYPALLDLKQFRDKLKDIKTRMVLDARSGSIKCRNKRLFAIPDCYAACEFYFLHIEQPKGLLEDGWVAAREFRDVEEIDVLRSPCCGIEHCIRKVTKDPDIYRWFVSNGIYTSCHDMISRVLQFDEPKYVALISNG